jgi:competence protein ComEC
VAWQHVVGTFEVEWLGDARPGGRISTASNRVRTLIERGLDSLPEERAALARGLVIGDDSDQSAAAIARMRDSGLAHLSAVSGQNVALVVAAASPLLRRARPLARWTITLALIAWFVVLTRAEPSVLRAGTMAAIGATAFALGRQREPLRLLAIAVVVLLLVDPLLAWSVGFWLSVGATAGVTGIGPPLAARLGRLGPLAMPVAVTLGAQAGVAIPSVVVFGRLPLVGVVANLLAVPVAGSVMLYGLPASLVAGVVAPLAPALSAPIGWGVWWVDAVATVGAAAEPGAPWSWVGWAVAGLVIAVLWGRD